AAPAHPGRAPLAPIAPVTFACPRPGGGRGSPPTSAYRAPSATLRSPRFARPDRSVVRLVCYRSGRSPPATPRCVTVARSSATATKDAFEILQYVAGKRLAAGRLSVIDGTSVQVVARRQLIGLARAHHCLLVAIVFNVPEKVCQERNLLRPERQFGPHVVRNQ